MFSRQDDYEQAARAYRECLSLNHAIGNRRGVAYNLEGLAGVAAAREQWQRAAHLFSVASALRDAIGVPVQPLDRPNIDRIRASIRAALGDERFAQAWAAGGAMTPEQAVRLALGGDDDTLARGVGADA